MTSLATLRRFGTAANEDTPLVVAKGGTGATTQGGAQSALGVPPNARTVAAGTMLSGGGDLSANRTIALADLAQALVIGRAAAAGTGAPSGLTAAQLITILLAADGAGSLLDADLLDGLNSTAFALLAGAAFTGAVTAAAGLNVTSGGLQVGGKQALSHAGSYTSGQVTISNAAPSGGSDGDIWFKY